MEKAIPILSQIADLILALSSLAWPLLAFLFVWLLRSRISELISLAVKKARHATEIEFGAFKLKGILVSQSGEVIRSGEEEYEIVEATKIDVEHRHSLHSTQRGLMLVHTIRPTEPEEFVKELRVFDVSVFLHSHRGNGKFSEVKQVEYFFGDKWGRGSFGSKFIVKSSRNQFSLTARMYGSCLCVAKIVFFDSQSVDVIRYLDVEMAPIYGIDLRDARQ